MSDSVILGLSLGAFTMFTTLMTIVLNGFVTNKQIRLLHELKLDSELTKAKIEATNQKVDEYHKETNSKLSQLVIAEKGVSFAEGEKQGRQEQEAKVIHTDEGGKTSVIKENLDQAKAKIDIAKKKLDK